MEPGGQISIKGDEGYIKIKSWDKNEVFLKMTKHARARTEKESERLLEDLQVNIESFKNRLIIKVDPKNEKRHYNFWDLLDPDTWGNNHRSVRVDFELNVPTNINLDLVNDEGDVEVEAIEGDLDIDVDEGDIHAKNITFNTLNLVADEGKIDAYDLNSSKGRLTINVDEGDVVIEKVTAHRLKIECDEGNVNIKDLSCRTCNISTDEGDVDVQPILGDSDRFYVTTDEGSVTFYLADRPNVSVDLETEDGRIRSDFDLNIKRDDDTQRCRDELGSGGAVIEAYASDGNIYIRKK